MVFVVVFIMVSVVAVPWMFQALQNRKEHSREVKKDREVIVGSVRLLALSILLVR